MTSTKIKWVALITMLIDHIGYVFFSGTPEGDLMRAIGRISFPLFAWQLAVSWKASKNRKRLVLLLAASALVSQVPYRLAFGNENLNIFFLFLTAVPALATDRFKNTAIQALAFLIAGLVAEAIGASYGFYGILLIAVFTLIKDRVLMVAVFAAISIMAPRWLSYMTLPQWAAIGATGAIWSYNGQRGERPMRWLFYVFYPAHLLLLAAIKAAIT